MASPSTEEQNYTRVCTILHTEGSAILKDMFFQEIGGSANLQAILSSTRDKIMALTESHILSRGQVDALYPTNATDTVDLNKVDIATMIELLKIVATSTPQDFKWNENPKEHEITKFHNVLRLKCLEDELKAKTEISLTESKYYYKNIDRILNCLDADLKQSHLYKIDNLEPKVNNLQSNKIEKINNTDQILGIQPKSKGGTCCWWCSVLFAIAVGLHAYCTANFTPEPGLFQLRPVSWFILYVRFFARVQLHKRV